MTIRLKEAHAFWPFEPGFLLNLGFYGDGFPGIKAAKSNLFVKVTKKAGFEPTER